MLACAVAVLATGWGSAMPAPAHASSVAMVGPPGAEVLHVDISDDGYQQGGRGIDVWQGAGSPYASAIISEFGSTVPLEAGAGCTAPEPPPGTLPRSVICAAAPVSVVIHGGSGNESIDVTATVPTVVDGGDGDDWVSTRGGGPVEVNGDRGDDMMSPGVVTGTVAFSGGDGRDRIQPYGYRPIVVSLDGVANDDVGGGGADNVGADVEDVQAGSEDDVLIGSDGSNHLDGIAGDDLIVGNGGSDRLELKYGCGGSVAGGTGDDEITFSRGATADGGAGDDTMRFSEPRYPCPAASSSTDIGGGGGTDLLDLAGQLRSSDVFAVSLDDVANDGLADQLVPDNVHADIENLSGGIESDIFVGSAGPNRLTGGSMPDVLIGGGGDDQLAGDLQDDLLDGGPGADVLEGGAGTDLADYTERSSPIVADPDGEHADDGEAGEGDTIATDVEDLRGGAGDDRLTGGPQDNLLSGGAGADRLAGLGGEDIADYSDRTDGLAISPDGAANDGEPGEHDDVAPDIEVLVGGSGDDQLSGGMGDQTLDGGPGADDLSGDPGRDAASYAERTDAVRITLGLGIGDDGALGEGDTIAPDVESARGGMGDDVLVGGTGDNVLDGGPGADELKGGTGLDAVDYSGRTLPVRADLSGSPGDDGEPAEGDTVGADIEGILGGSGSDVLTGSGSDGILDGGAGGDRLSDPGGADRIWGRDGGDIVLSRDGAIDAVDCGAGSDRATVDAADDVGASCETVDGPSESPSATGTHPPSISRGFPPIPSPPAIIVARAWVSRAGIIRAGAAKARGIRLNVHTTVPCSASATAVPAGRTASALVRRGIGRRTVFARGSVRDVVGATIPLTLRVTRQGRRMLTLLGSPRFVVTVRFSCLVGGGFVRTTLLGVRR